MASDDIEKHQQELEENYYSVLNLSKDANDREITQAYHRFGLLYHPDRHKNQKDKRDAELLFSKIKRAYDVLSDPHKRAIYDSVGVKGLKQQGWQIITRTKSPKEIREEYERLAKEREEKRLQELTNSVGYFNMGIDARSLLSDGYEPFDFHITNFEMQQIIDVPLTTKDSVSVSVDMDTNKRDGIGTISGTIRRVISPDTWLEGKIGFGSSRGASVKALKRLSQRCTGSLGMMLSPSRDEIKSSIVSSISYQLTKTMVGRIEWVAGYKSSMKTSVEYNNKHIHVEVNCKLSLKHSSIGCDVSKNFLNDELSVKGSIKYTYLGLILSYGVNKKISQFSSVGASILFGSNIGVYLNIRYDRATQSFVFPIHLSNEILPSAIFYGSLAPIAFYFVTKKLIVEPYLNSIEEKKIKDKQDQLKNELAEKRKEALIAQELMKDAYARSIDREGQNGLIIIKGLYGKIENSTTINETSEKIIDVTVPLQVLIKDHSLQILTESTKSDLQGFYDPCYGEGKQLYIRYKFNDQMHETMFGDNEVVRIPKKSHRMQHIY